MGESFGKYFVLNGELNPSALFRNTMVYEGESVYEVIRMVKGSPIFFNDHLDRLVSSVRFQGRIMLADRDQLKKDIQILSSTEKKKEINLKIVFNYNENSENYFIYYIEPVYPTEEQYRTGVRGILYHAERFNPESKVINHRLRSSIYHRLILEGAFEALLVDRDTCITEGSRSNIFFIKGDTLYTAPENKVLNGITRKHIIEICGENGINIVFECVGEKRLSEFESAIMTGTSPIVLPFSVISGHIFNVRHNLISSLRSLYLIKAEESIRQFRDEKV